MERAQNKLHRHSSLYPLDQSNNELQVVATVASIFIICELVREFFWASAWLHYSKLLTPELGWIFFMQWTVHSSVFALHYLCVRLLIQFAQYHFYCLSG